MSDAAAAAAAAATTTTVEIRPCAILWTCPGARLLGCEYGLYSWNPCHEKTYTGCGFEGTFAAALSQAETRACMSPDNQIVELIQAKFGENMYMAFEVIPRGFFGCIVPGGLSGTA